jgi:D-tyrosyl-tRNA(Tyr) deacylase
MRVLLQRVTRGSVTVAGEVVGAIERGYVLLLGVGREDTEADADKLAGKIVQLRLFANEAGRFDRSLLEVGGGALVVSQFTLYGNTAKGRRPSFDQAAPPERAEPMYEYFVAKLRQLGVARVETGRFGASMSVELCNDGPVTLWLEG